LGYKCRVVELEKGWLLVFIGKHFEVLSRFYVDL